MPGTVNDLHVVMGHDSTGADKRDQHQVTDMLTYLIQMIRIPAMFGLLIWMTTICER